MARRWVLASIRATGKGGVVVMVVVVPLATGVVVAVVVL
jgi:hypothetical protein